MAGRRSPSEGSRSRPRWVKRLKQTLVVSVILLGIAVIGASAVYYPIYREAKENALSIDRKLVVNSSDPSVMLSADGVVLYRISLVRRTVVDVDTLPSYVRYAMVAAEDRRFYDHRGVDLVGLLRTAFVAVRDRRASQGGSTIDMQLAKKLVNGDDRNMTRKLKDIATAGQIESLKTKSQILNLYMNVVYFGEGAWGIDAAAETYFNKKASELTVGEAAMLARCVRSPSRMNPIKDLEDSLKSRDYVLGIMREEGWISDEQYENALKESPKINHASPEGTRWERQGAGYFVDHALAQLHRDFPNIELQSGGYKIVTTLNWGLQKAANQAVADSLAANRRRKVNDAAFLLIDADGRILAEVGGPGYAKSKWNVVTQGMGRQPGSAFKAFLYAAALKDGIVHPGDYVSNEPIVEVDPNTGKVWAPRNNTGDFTGGTMSLTSAFALSYNLPAIHTIQALHPDTLVNYAKDIFGFRSQLPRYDSLAIGTGSVHPIEMAEGYSVFMLKGDRVRPYPIEKITGPDGSVTKDYQPLKFTGVLDPGICQEVDDLLQAVVLHGTGRAAIDVPNARGKTGTTQNATDAWFCGYSDNLLGVAWVGNTNYKTGKAGYMAGSVFGGNVSAVMWAQVLLAAHRLNLAKPPEEVKVASRPREQTVVAKAAEVPPDVNSVTTEDPAESAVPDASAAPSPSTIQTPKTQPTPAAPPPQLTMPPMNPPVQTRPAARPVVHRPPPPSDDESNYVEVQVCADTGMRASVYCPETVTRRFKRGTEPKQVCRLHTGG